MNTISRGRALAIGIAVVAGSGGGACGGSAGGDLGPPPLVLAKAPTKNGDQQSGPAGVALTDELRVVVTRDGVPEAGVSVDWSATQGSVSPVSAPTGSDGISAATWTLGPVAGAQAGQAEVAGATGSPVGFTATAVEAPPVPPAAPPPSALVLAKAPTGSGDNQSGRAGMALDDELRVIVTRNGSPEAGVTVVWTSGDGALDPPSGLTDADGIGAATWTLGPNAGAQTASAGVAAATGSPVSFAATATAAPPPPPPPPPPPSPPTAIDVTVGNVFFRSARNGTDDPAIDTVAVNGTVTWTWTATGTARHSVESTGSPSFTSSAILTGNGQTYSVQFAQPGTYSYDCAVHGSDMTGRIVVR